MSPPDPRSHLVAAGFQQRCLDSLIKLRGERIVTFAGHRLRQRSSGGAAARRAERPTRVLGTIRPDPGSSWSPRRPPSARLAIPGRRHHEDPVDQQRPGGQLLLLWRGRLRWDQEPRPGRPGPLGHQPGRARQLHRPVPTAPPGRSPAATSSTGTGTLEGARGSALLVDNGVVLNGKKDILGDAVSTSTLASRRTAGTAWTGGTWNGRMWSGDGWSGNIWSSAGWNQCFTSSGHGGEEHASPPCRHPRTRQPAIRRRPGRAMPALRDSAALPIGTA